jgi:hypothetical protein
MTPNDAQNPAQDTRTPAPTPDGTTQGLSGAQTGYTPLPPDARMEGYYIGFDRTGCDPVDAILSAVAIAGKGSHSTEGWNDQSDYYANRPGLPDLGPETTANELIQKTADRAAREIADRADRLEHEADVGRRWAAQASVLERERDEARRAHEAERRALLTANHALRKADAQVERVRALHVRVQDGIAGQGPRSNWSPTYGCGECSTEDVRVAWPCPTIAALAGSESGL